MNTYEQFWLKKCEKSVTYARKGKQWKGDFLVNPAGIYLLKVNNRNTRTRCEICSKLIIKTPERRLASFWCLYC